MINETHTFDDFGYMSKDLSHGSGKPIYAKCDTCGYERLIRYNTHLKTQGKCRSCARTGKHPTKETRKKMSIASSNPSKEIRKKMSIAQSGKKNHHYGKSPTEESRRRQSATQQGISYDEWESYAINSPYCPLFNESCRESNREKYNRQCFICGCNESKNITSTGKQCKLSVHHVDLNKQQGCNNHAWKLIPVCMHCHRKLHTKHMESCIEYILKYNEV